jgi:hypothetical protein
METLIGICRRVLLLMQKPHSIPKTRCGFISFSVHPVANTRLGPVATSRLKLYATSPPIKSIHPLSPLRRYSHGSAFAPFENTLSRFVKIDIRRAESFVAPQGLILFPRVSWTESDANRRRRKLFRWDIAYEGNVSTDGALVLRLFRNVTFVISAAMDQRRCVRDR